MSAIDQLSVEERQLFFDTAVTESGMPPSILEKDFWVVWTLERIFSLPKPSPYLTFKGGTSLSKVYRLIERFSEDIDVSIEKDFFGFQGDNDPEKAPSKKKLRSAIERLAQACASYVQGDMLKDLREVIAKKLGTADGWELTVDPKDPDGQTLLFDYPTRMAKGSYIEPSVKIEFGARSEHWPVSKQRIQSYLKEILKEKVTENPIEVRVLNAERTFWEKATILHQYAHFPEGKTVPRRISRHYYDFYCLLNSRIKAHASQNHALLERVAVHKNIYFSSAWANYDSARKGTLKLAPSNQVQAGLEEDYKLMNAMFFGSIPDLNQVLQAISKFESEFNH